MNTTKAIELAMAETLRKYVEMGAAVVVRAWQSLESDGSWDEKTDREFPLIDVRCSPPGHDDNESTLQVQCAILMGTKTDDDKNHAFVSNMYEDVQGVCDTLFAQYKTRVFTGDDKEELAYFLARVVAETSTDAFQFGGLTFGDGLAPADDNGINMIGITMIVHYGRSDF